MAHICSNISQAILKNDIKKLKQLIKNGKRIDIKDNLGFTPLHIAVQKQNVGCVAILLKDSTCSTLINERSFEGYTSLYLACNKLKPNLKIIKLLLENGANSNIPNNENIFPLHLVCQHGDLKSVKLFLKYKSDINCQDFDEYTPLHFAVNYNKLNVIEHLLKYKPDVNLTDCYGLNPFMLAIVRNNLSAAETLLNHTKNLNHKAKDGVTAINLAIQSDNLTIVEKLLEKNVDVTENEFSLMNLYNNLQIFLIFWEKTNLKNWFNNSTFVNILTTKLTARFHLPQLTLIAKVENFKLNVKSNVFSSIFKLVEVLDETYFKENQNDIWNLIIWLVHQKVVLETSDLITFIEFLKYCPYGNELLIYVIKETDVEINEHVFLTSFLINPDFSFILLESKCHLNSMQIYNAILKNNINLFQFVSPYFSPSFLHFQLLKNSVKLDTDENCVKMLKYFDGRVKSLLEIARDRLRNLFALKCKLVETKNYFKILDDLRCPTHVKNIISCKIAVNKVI